jgi:hypothetical protein
VSQPTAYSDQLHAQARDIATRLLAAAAAHPEPFSAFELATGPIAESIEGGASCCLPDQLGLAAMVIAELLRRHGARGRLVRPLGDHPHTDPGDGRPECLTCGKFVWPVTHSCKGVPVTDAARQRATARREREA